MSSGQEKQASLSDLLTNVEKLALLLCPGVFVIPLVLLPLLSRTCPEATHNSFQTLSQNGSTPPKQPGVPSSLSTLTTSNGRNLAKCRLRLKLLDIPHDRDIKGYLEPHTCHLSSLAPAKHQEHHTNGSGNPKSGTNPWKHFQGLICGTSVPRKLQRAEDLTKWLPRCQSLPSLPHTHPKKRLAPVKSTL